MAFIACLAFSVYFFVTFKTYHAHLTKQEQLNTLLKNPNARVASGKKGKQVVKKLMAKNQEIKAVAQIEEETTADEESLQTLIKAAKAKKAQKIVDEKSELLLSGYQAPKISFEAPSPQVTYQLIEPVAKPVMATPMVQAPSQQQYWYPQNFEALPVPQMVSQPTAKVVIAQPEPMREPLPAKQPDLSSLPKNVLIKALLEQLAKAE